MYSYKNDSLAAKKEPRKSAHGDANTEYSPPSLKNIAKNTVKDFRYFNAKDVTEFMGGESESYVGNVMLMLYEKLKKTFLITNQYHSL